MLVGYARVSTKDQSLDIQREALEEAGCEKIFYEKESGASMSKRRELDLALEFVREGDTLLVYKLDRLARSVFDLHQILSRLELKNVNFRSLNDASIDTTSPQGKLMINILGSVAEFERELIKERQAIGIAKAKTKGKYTGRKKSLNEEKEKELRCRWLNRKANESAKEIAKEFGISKATLYRYLPS